jgi:hypothetical protein
MVNNVLVFGPDGNVFFCAINYPGSWVDRSLTARFFSHIKGKIGDYKYVSIRDSRGVGTQLGF